MKRKIIVVTILSFILLGCFDKKQEITIIHTDALKARVLSKNKNGINVGGFSLLSGAIKSIKNKNSKDFDILLDAGSSLTGSVFSFYTQGEAIVELMNNMGYDAITIGNREFDSGLQMLKEVEIKYNTNLLSANITDLKNDLVFKNYIIKESNKGLKIAIIGMTYEETPKITMKSAVKNLNFLNSEFVLEKLLPEVEKKSDYIILLSSLRLEKDTYLAKKFGKSIDLIISRTNDYDFIDKPININGVDIIYTKGKTASIGEYKILLSKKQGVLKKSWENHKVDSKNFQPSKETGSIIEKYSKKIDDVLFEKIGETKNKINYNIGKESEISNFVTDVLREKTKSDISFINDGGIRSGLEKVVTKGDIYKVFPFNNVVCKFELNGRDIKTLLERSVTFEKGPLLASGLTYSYSLKKPKMKRVVESKINGIKIDDNKKYTVTSIDFLLEGGDGYKEFKKAENIEFLYNLRALLSDYISHNSPVDSKLDGRFIEIK